MDLIAELFNSVFDAPFDTLQILIYLIAGICIWLLLREIKCWYWKINDIIAEQKKQTEVLEQIHAEIQRITRKNP